jgi:hypothetical protein
VDVIWHYYENVLDYVRKAVGQIVPGSADDVSCGSKVYVAIVDYAQAAALLVGADG